MTVLETIRKRYSCRSYADKPIEREKLDQVLEAARLAPSAKNLQDWRFVVVTDKQKKQQVAEAANNQLFLAEAAAIIIACTNSDHVMGCGQQIGPQLMHGSLGLLDGHKVCPSCKAQALRYGLSYTQLMNPPTDRRDELIKQLMKQGGIRGGLL